MDQSSSGLMGLLAQKMAYLNQRSSVLAENVANANVPKYKAKDLAPFTFGDALAQAGTGMVTTNPKHILPAGMAGVNAQSVKAKSFETLPTGNSVDLEQQMMQVSENSVNYKFVTGLYKQMTTWFRLAIKSS